MSGPPPKRSDQRRRANEPASGPPTKATTPAQATKPDADESWYPPMAAWYDSLERSGQSAFYTDADWNTAWVIADAMSRELNPQPVVVDDAVQMLRLPVKAATLAAFLKACTQLLATEGDRRRVGLELTKAKTEGDEDGEVSWIDDARNRLRGTS